MTTGCAKQKSKATHFEVRAVSLAKAAFGSVGKNIISLFVN